MVSKVKWELLSGSSNVAQYLAKLKSGWLFKEVDSNGKPTICYIPDEKHVEFESKPEPVAKSRPVVPVEPKVTEAPIAPVEALKATTRKPKERKKS